MSQHGLPTDPVFSFHECSAAMTPTMSLSFPFLYSILSLQKCLPVLCILLCLLSHLFLMPSPTCPHVCPFTSSAFSQVPSGVSCPSDKHLFLSTSTQSCHRLPACLHFWWALGFLKILKTSGNLCNRPKAVHGPLPHRAPHQVQGSEQKPAQGEGHSAFWKGGWETSCASAVL